MVSYPLINRVYGWLHGNPSRSVEIAPPAPTLAVITPDMMSPFAPAPVRYSFHDGEKFPGGFGATEVVQLDYWTLRARSASFFKTNLYARGVVRRLVTNVVCTGLNLEATPEESILGLEEDSLADWSEGVECRFSLWARSPSLCDYKGQKSFGALQAVAKQAALISGDVLVVLQQSPVTGLPLVRLVDGSRVQSPFGATPNEPKLAAGHCIRHGVELGADGRHVAYWIVSSDEALQRKVERLPCMGATGRRLAFLVYGSDKMLDDVRGEPILSLILQSLRDLDRYRDAAIRKAVINSILAIFIKREQEVLGTRPLTGGAVLRGKETVATGIGDKPRTFNTAGYVPGLILEELAAGESPQGFPSTGTDEKLGDFEATIINAIAWALEIPGEVLTLGFKNNYSASQAATNEFKLYLEVVRDTWGQEMAQPIYVEWLLAETLGGRIKADGLLDSWRDPSQFDKFAAWVSSDWTGMIKPSIDINKQATGYTKLIEQGLITRDKAAREITGTKYSKNVKKLRLENEALVEANKPIVGMEAAAKAAVAPVAPPATPPKRDLAIVPKPKGPKEEGNPHVVA
jgi:lambda family phage portal protein